MKAPYRSQAIEAVVKAVKAPANRRGLTGEARDRFLVVATLAVAMGWIPEVEMGLPDNASDSDRLQAITDLVGNVLITLEADTVSDIKPAAPVVQ